MRKLLLFLGLIIGVLFYSLGIALLKLDNERKEKERYKANTEVLLQDLKYYTTDDSTNVAEVGVLRLQIGELEKYRADDMNTIKQLQGRNDELQNLTKAQSVTITSLQGQTYDSIVYIDRYITDTLRCVQSKNDYIDFSGCIDRYEKFDGTITNRDTLIISAFVKYKRFLGFLWKTNKVKERRVDAISRNPYTTIGGLEYYEVYY